MAIGPTIRVLALTRVCYRLCKRPVYKSYAASGTQHCGAQRLSPLGKQDAVMSIKGWINGVEGRESRIQNPEARI